MLPLNSVAVIIIIRDRYIIGYNNTIISRINDLICFHVLYNNVGIKYVKL